MRFIFIGGCPRSGTTLVQKILLSHSKITGSREFDFLSALGGLYDQMRTPIQLERQCFFYNGNELEKYWKDFIEKLLTGNIRDKEKYEYFSEKTPLNIMAAPTLLELFGDSIFIYVYRDGRDVVNSLKQAKKRADEAGEQVPWSTAYWPFMWRERAQQYEKLKNDSRFKNRHMAVRYEDLVESPRATIMEIMSFLGLDAEEKQFSPEKFSSVEFESRIDKVWYTKEMYEQGINNKNILKWRKGLNVFEKIRCQVIMAKCLKEYSYPVSPVYVILNTAYFKLRSVAGKAFQKLK